MVVCFLAQPIPSKPLEWSVNLTLRNISLYSFLAKKSLLMNSNGLSFRPFSTPCRKNESFEICRSSSLGKFWKLSSSTRLLFHLFDSGLVCVWWCSPSLRLLFYSWKLSVTPKWFSLISSSHLSSGQRPLYWLLLCRNTVIDIKILSGTQELANWRQKKSKLPKDKIVQKCQNIQIFVSLTITVLYCMDSQIPSHICHLIRLHPKRKDRPMHNLLYLPLSSHTTHCHSSAKKALTNHARNNRKLLLKVCSCVLN